MSGRRVVVTGAGGFVGSAICHAFSTAGDRVFALLRKDTVSPGARMLAASAERRECDLARDPERLSSILRELEPEVVIHAAVRNAYAPFDLVATVADNVVATGHLLSALQALPSTPRLVALGSSTEYGRAPGPIDESAPLAPINLRGATKAAASLLVLAESAAGRIEAGVLRPFTVYGPFEPAVRLIPRAISVALGGGELPLAPTDAAHDFVFVDDVAQACLAAAEAPAFPGSAWNVCSGQTCSNASLLALLERLLDRPIACRAGALSPGPLDRPDWFGNASRTRHGLGWQATTSLEEGLTACSAFWRAELERHQAARR